MLTHYPSLPLIIDHLDEDHDITTEDEEGISLALQHRDRVRRIRLRKSISILRKLINALDGEYPILDYLYVLPQKFLRPAFEPNMTLELPETFRAPHLCKLSLMSFAIPIGSPLLTTTGNLVTLTLDSIPPSAYFLPNALLQRLSLMPQLEILGIAFNTYYPSGDVAGQLLRTPITTRVTLPNLHQFEFQGSSAYLEALLPRVTVPLLDKLYLYFFNQLTYSIPHLQHFMSTAGNLRPKTATLTFREDYLDVMACHEGARMSTLEIVLGGRHLDWQVASAAQAFHTLGTAFSTVEHLTLQYDRHSISLELINEADRTQWHELLGSVGNVKTLSVGGELVKQLSHCLQPGEGEPPTELLPELEELSYSALASSFDGANAFIPFIDGRQKAGRPVTIIHP